MKHLLLLFLCCTSVIAAAPGGFFTLTSHQGESWSLQDREGSITLLFFGFTHCPVICPDTLIKVSQVLRSSADLAIDVGAVFVTVDPERDTVTALNHYIPHFHPDIVGLTGSSAQIEKVTDQYQIQVSLNKQKNKQEDKQDTSSEFYSVDHTASIYVLGPDMTVDTIVPYGMPADHLLAVVRGLARKHTDVQLQHEAMESASSDSTPESESTSVATHESTQTSTQTSAQRPEQGHPLTQLKLTTLTDEPLTTSNLATLIDTDKPVLINFWATWCTPCRREIPALNEAWKLLAKENVQMLAINIGENPVAVQAFVQDYPIDFPLALDQHANSMENWKIVGLPTTVLLNNEGQPLLHYTGEKPWNEQPIIDELLQALN